MTTLVDADPHAAAELVLAHLADSGQQQRIEQLYTAKGAAALCGGLLQLLVVMGCERYGGPDELRKALQLYLAALDLEAVGLAALMPPEAADTAEPRKDPQCP